MPSPKALPPADLIRALFRYEPATGHFFHLRQSRRRAIGTRAGSTDKLGYVWLKIEGYKLCGAHRIAWLLEKNEQPETVDHIDGNPNNNAIANLRAATRREQMHNRRVGSNNQSGHKGVFMDPLGTAKKRWRAMIFINGKKTHLGGFPTVEEASQAYRSAARDVFGQFCPGDDRLKAARILRGLDRT